MARYIEDNIMKLTKSKLKQMIKEEIQKLNEAKDIKGKHAGNYVKMAPKGRKITIKDTTYTSLGKGKWKGPNREKLNWIEISAKASALGNKTVQYEEIVKEAGGWEAPDKKVYKELDKLSDKVYLIAGRYAHKADMETAINSWMVGLNAGVKNRGYKVT